MSNKGVLQHLECKVHDRKMSTQDNSQFTPIIRPSVVPSELPEPLELPPNVSELAEKGKGYV